MVSIDSFDDEFLNKPLSDLTVRQAIEVLEGLSTIVKSGQPAIEFTFAELLKITGYSQPALSYMLISREIPRHGKGRRATMKHEDLLQIKKYKENISAYLKEQGLSLPGEFKQAA